MSYAQDPVVSKRLTQRHAHDALIIAPTLACEKQGLGVELSNTDYRLEVTDVLRALAKKYEFENFCLLDLVGENERASLTTQLLLHDFPPGLSETYDERYCFSETDMSRYFYSSTTPWFWNETEKGPDQVEAPGFLAQIGYPVGLTIPVHTITGSRYVIVFLGDNEDIDQATHYRLCHESMQAFDEFQKNLILEHDGSRLTRREREILQWISDGKTAGEIAIIASVSEHTVSSHTAAILKKLDVVNRTQMVVKAMRLQLIR